MPLPQVSNRLKTLPASIGLMTKLQVRYRLCAPYAMSGTGTAYGAIRLCGPCTRSETHIAYGAVCIRASDAMSGTHIASAVLLCAMRCPVLTWRMALPDPQPVQEPYAGTNPLPACQLAVVRCPVLK
eukprot:919417-Rhodomonas_salina.7